MSRLFSLAAFCALSVTSLDPAWADSCQSLDITGFSEGDVVYRERPNQAWKEVTNIASLSGSLLPPPKARVSRI